MRQKKQKE